MAEYKVICNFKDLQDNGHFYTVGDSFPRDGKKVTKKRLAELASDKNRRGKPMIEELEEAEAVED